MFFLVASPQTLTHKERIMKKEKFIIACLVIGFVLLNGVVLAQSKAGTSAAPELLIPVSAKYVGMSGSTAASVKGVDAIFWNPAGVDVTGETNSSALFSFRQYIADIGINTFAVSTRFEGLGSVGLSLRSFNIGDIGVTTEDQPDGTGEIISPTFFTLGLSYSKELTDRVSIGTTVNLVNEAFGGVSASGVAFDAGVQYRNLMAVDGLSLGVAVKNIGTTMKYGGSNLWRAATDPAAGRGLTYYKVEAATFQMPSTIEIGVGYIKSLDENSKAEINTTFQNNNFGIDEYRVGAQYSFMNVLSVRAGYNYSTAPSGTKSIFQNYTIGGGVNFSSVADAPVEIDYAYVPVEIFSANHIFDIRIKF